jgi:glycosyltransferase involved in cell wall biosynthesis
MCAESSIGPGRRPRRIVYVHHGKQPGGAPTSLRNLVYGVRQNTDYQLKILCVYPDMMEYFAELDGVGVQHYGSSFTTSGRGLLGMSPLLSPRMLKEVFSDLVTARRIVRSEMQRLSRESPDLVHLNSSILWSTALACRLSGIPLVWHVREASMASTYAPHLLLYSTLIKRLADKVVCIGPIEYEKIRGHQNPNVVVVRNSLDHRYFDGSAPSKPAARQALDLPPDNFIYLSLGGLNYRKGTYELLEATRELSEASLCLLAGPFPSRTAQMTPWVKGALAWEDTLMGLGLIQYRSSHYPQRVMQSLAACAPERLRIVGQVKDVRQHIAAADAVVFADTTSHSGRPVFEAWALKKPVVAFDTPAMRREIAHGRDGLLVSPREPGALAAALELLRAKPDLARRLGEAGHIKASEQFHPAKNVRLLLDVYDDLWRTTGL